MRWEENRLLRGAISTVRAAMAPAGSPTEAFANGDYVEAAARYAALIRKDAENPEFLIGRANALSHAGLKNEAAQAVEAAAAVCLGAGVPDADRLRVLYDIAAANGLPAVQQTLAGRLAALDPADDHFRLMPLAILPRYHAADWKRRLSDLGQELLAKPDCKTQAIDLLCQLAAGAQDTPLTHAASGRLAVAVPDEERHLLTWLQTATALGPDMDPGPILDVAAKRQMTPALAGLLVPFARVCEMTGRLEAALAAFRMAMSDEASRSVAANAAVRLTLSLHGLDGLQKLDEHLAAFPLTPGLARARLALLTELGDDEAVLALAATLTKPASGDPESMAYRAVAVVLRDEAAAAAMFRSACRSSAGSPQVEFSLQRAVNRLLANGRDAAAFLAQVGFSETNIRSRLSLGRMLMAMEASPALRDDVIELMSGPWWSRSLRTLTNHLEGGAIRSSDYPLARRIAYLRAGRSLPVRADDLMPMRADDPTGVGAALGLLRREAMGDPANEEARIALARFNATRRIKAGRIWTKPEWTIDPHERLELWRQVAAGAPEDSSVRRQLDLARRAATPPILFVGMPRGGSVYVYHGLLRGLGKRGIGGVMAGAFPNFTLCQEGFQLMKLLNATSHTHLGPTEFNLREIGQRYRVEKMLVHVRDPRQALLSWHDFLPGVITSLDPTQAFHYKLPADYLARSSAEQLDWLVDNWLPVITEWIVGWAEAPALDYFETDILFTTFEEMKRDQSAFFAKILDFYGIDRDLFTEPVAARGASNYRQGDTDTWRTVLNAAQKRKVRDTVPDWLLEKFGWPPT